MEGEFPEFQLERANNAMQHRKCWLNTNTSYLRTVRTTCPVTGPQLVTVLLEGPDPTYVSEAGFITTVTLVPIPQYDVVSDVSW